MLDAFSFGLAELSVKLGISAAVPDRKCPQPASNVQLYLAEAILPELEIAEDKTVEINPEGHRLHKNVLTVKRELFRNLSRIVQLLPDVHDANVLEFAKERISSVNLTGDAAELPPGDLTIQCPEYFKVAERNLTEVDSVAGVRDWVYEFPLTSVQRALHLQFPETRNFALRSFQDPVVNSDKDIALWYTWSGYRTNGEPHTKMVVMIQLPWIVGTADVDAFTGCTEFPKYEVRGSRYNAFRSWERLWAQVWDVCRRQQCHWFVYTTYESWVFGCFSPAWSGAHVTSVKKAQAKSPTVLQSLVYWFAASMGMTLYNGPTEMPEFTEDFEMAAGSLPPHQIKGPIPSPPPSESVWTARSSARDATSEFGGNSESRLSRLAMSDAGIPERLTHTPRPRPGEADDLRKRVTIWKETHDGVAGAPPSEAGVTEHTETSVGTVTLTVGGQPRAFREEDREIDWVGIRVPM